MLIPGVEKYMQLLGRELEISGEKEEAAVITGIFSRIGSDSAELFRERFKDEFCNLDAALAGVEDLAGAFFEASVKRAENLLADRGIGVFTEESLTAYLKNNEFFSIWDESLQKFIEKNNSIEQELCACKDDRREAGEVAKAQIFELMEEYMAKAMTYTISGFASAVMSLITGETGTSFSAPTSEEVIRSKELYDNVISGKVPEKDRVDTIFEAITLNPNNSDAFYFLVLKYGDSDCEIEKAGEYFGNPIGQMKFDKVSAYQKKMLSQQMAVISAMEGKEYIKALESLKVGFSNIKHNMGISPDLTTQAEKDIEEALRKCREPDPEPEKEPEPADKLQKIRELCTKFKAESAVRKMYEPTKKLIRYLDLKDDEEIYLGHDKTILGSGKDGFAITNLGIICVSGKEAHEITYSELAEIENIHLGSDDFKSDIMADGTTLIKCLPSEKDDILGLVNAIREVCIYDGENSSC